MGQLQDAVLVGGGDALLVDARHVEAAGEGAEAALPADVVPPLVLLLTAGRPLGGDGEDAVLQVELDVLLAEAGELRLQNELVALVPDVRAEGDGAGGIAEEIALEVVEGVKQVVLVALKGNHTEHKILSFHTDIFRNGGEALLAAPVSFLVS